MKNIVILILALIIFSCSDDDTNQDDAPPKIDFKNELDVLQTFGGSQEDDALSVVETADGHIAVFGYTQSPDGDVEGKTTTDSDYWLIVLDKDLNVLWQSIFGGSNDDRGQDIVATTDGGFLISGFSRSDDGDVGENFGFHDYWVLKLNSSGSIVWEKSFGFAGNDRCYAAIQTKDGGYFLSGFLDVSASGGEGNDNGKTKRKPLARAKHGVGEFWGIKLDAEGETQWRRYFGGSNNDRSYDVLQTMDNNFIMMGSSESDDFDISQPKGSYDFWAVKVDNDGNLIWDKNFGGSSLEIGYSINMINNSTLVLAGDTRSNNGDVSNFRGNTDFWLTAMDTNSDRLWEKTYGGSDFESARDVITLFNGDLLICGSTKSTDGQVSQHFGQNDIWIVNTNTDGNLKSELSIGGTGLDFANKAVELQDGSVIVVGSSESSDNLIAANKGNKDIVVIKLK